MSTRTVRFAPLLCALALAAGLCGPALAQQDAGDEDVVGPMLEEARKTYRVDPPEPERPADCPEAVGNEILVCAPVESDPDRYRITSSLDKGDDSHLSWGGEAPDVSGPGIFKGPATVGGLCFIPPCPKDPVYVVDVAALPEAPPGSDADRIARGLAPRGSRFDDGETQVAAMESEEEPADPAVDHPSQSSAEPDEMPES
ncbi:hypothetical protein [Citromicrobium bathyomarinum]|uniref:hypothetical protein n=1 Tax=Citromicrobium bathyomarinum TaxID=72174 RepID=UPI00315AF250